MALSVSVFYLGQRMLVHFHTMWGLFWLSELDSSVLSIARAVVLQGSRLGVWFILSTRKPSRTTVKNTVLHSSSCVTLGELFYISDAQGPPLP